jgi:hypothetical protein
VVYVGAILGYCRPKKGKEQEKKLKIKPWIMLMS